MLSAWLSDLAAPFRWLVGSWGGDATYLVARWLFLRALGIIALVAFLSFWVQLAGLVGRRGILPAQRYLVHMRDRLGRARFRWIPTIFWLDARDGALHLACAAGVVLAGLLAAGIAQPVCLLGLWALYLSLVAVSGEFLSFQWDVLLIETCLLAILVAPWSLPPDPWAPVSAVGLVLLWWLLFRLMFQSGVVKLTSGDPTWRDLTAMQYHWWTQPLPTWPAWWMHKLPARVQKGTVAFTYLVEILVPLLIFGPRPARLVACGAIILLQLVIMATGNYTFFNLLTIALALLLVDDATWAAIGWCPLPGGCADPDVAATPPAAQTLTGLVLAVPFLVLGAARLWTALRPASGLPAWLARVLTALEPFRTINGYGLFRVMTTRRPEIEVQGSRDGEHWEPYAFRWKPGDPARRPRFVQPHQPRLDWQMWFAALSGPGRAPWLLAFLDRLLEGSPPVLRLLRANPFPDAPPRYVRARLWDYRFTTATERRKTGDWWSRSLLGDYGPPVTRGAVD